jgi:hypothetical protein
MSYYAGAIDFKTAGGTATQGSIEEVSSESPISAWLASPQARTYEGKWVFLSDRLEPLDDDLSPSALQRRHESPDSAGVIVFVRPTSVQIGA